MTDLASKESLRKAMRQRRKSLPAELRLHEESQVHLRLKAHFARLPNPAIAMYLALGSEFDLKADAAVYGESTLLFVPVIQKNQMTFAKASAPWKVSDLGFREPANGPNRSAEELDAILLPLLACDAQGTRLGQGGGWYDRTLQSAADKRPPCIGVGFDLQLVDTLPRETHDQSLDAFISARGARAFSEKGKQWLIGY